MIDAEAKPKPRHWLAWVNQPSTLQPRHDLHGKRCVVYDQHERYVQVFFTEGTTRSTVIDRQCLSLVPR